MRVRSGSAVSILQHVYCSRNRFAAACLRADAALHALSIADITELRAYKFPPPQVSAYATRVAAGRVPIL